MIMETQVQKKNDLAESITELKTPGGNIIPFDFEQPVKEVRKDKYTSEKLLDPKSQTTKDKYFKIYEEYVMSHKTEKQLADKFDINLSTVSRIIKWVSHQIGDIDPNAQLKATIDTLKHRQQTIQGEYDKCETITDKSKVWKALLQIDRLLSQLQGLLGTALIDMSEKKELHVHMNDDFQRRTGSAGGQAKAEEKGVPGETIEEWTERQSDIKRRTE